MGEQESISNSNIMRVKKFQRELESAENRAEEAESTLNQFRSRERVFASASARSEKSTDVQETEVVVKKTINKVNIVSSSTEESSSSALASRDIRAGSVAGVSYSRGGSGRIHLQGLEHGQGGLDGKAMIGSSMGFLLSPLLDTTSPASATFNCCHQCWHQSFPLVLLRD